MTVIHIVPAISNEASGPSYSVVRLCESLIDAGTAVTPAALGCAPIDKPRACLRTFPLSIGPRRLGQSPAIAHWLDSEARSGRVAVLHNHSLWILPNVYSGRTARKFNLQYVVAPRGTLSAWAKQSGSKVKKLFLNLVQRPALGAVTCFHATAVHGFEDIRRMGFRKPVAIVPMGIDLQPLIEKTTGGMRTLLFLGPVHPVKGLDMLLPAWRADAGLLGAMYPADLVMGWQAQRSGNARRRQLPEWARALPGPRWLRRGVFAPAELLTLVGPDLAAGGLLGFSPTAWRGERCGTLSSQDKLVSGQIESTTHLRKQLLRDRNFASMDHSVELRTPLVDARLPRDMQPLLSAFSHFPKKRLLALALPAAVISRPKTGFGIPVQTWLKQQGVLGVGGPSHAWAREVARVYASGAGG